MSRLRHEVRRRLAGAAVAAVVSAASLAFHEPDFPFLGDEPSYLLYATSLGHGWGVDLERAYEPGNRQWISAGGIESHAQVWRPGGPMASWHGVGLPLVLSPLAGRVPAAGIRGCMIAIAALLAYHLFTLVRTVTRAPSLAAGAAVVAVLASPPVIFHSWLVYPEVLAGLLLVIALRCLCVEPPAGARLAGASVAAALMPWLNMRYATLTLGLAMLIAGRAYTAAQRPRLTARLAAALALVRPATLAGMVILGALALFNIELYGALLPGSTPDERYFRLRNLYVYGVGGLIGFPLGVVPFAPVLMVALASVPWASLWIGRWRTAAVMGLAVGYWGFTGYFGSAGFTAPGRYFVTIVPLLAVPLAVVMLHGRGTARGAVAVALALTAWSTTTSAAHYLELYGSERRNIRPFGLAPSIWPLTVDETLEGATTVSGEAGGFGSQVGSLEQLEGSTYMVGREGRDTNGFLSFGPFARLRRGRYEAAFELILEADRPVAPARIQAAEYGGEVLSAVDVPFPVGGSRRTTEVVEFDKRGWLEVGLQVIYPGEGMLGSRKMSARLVEPFPQPAAEEDAWKAVLWGAGLAGVALAWRRAARPRETT